MRLEFARYLRSGEAATGCRTALFQNQEGRLIFAAALGWGRIYWRLVRRLYPSTRKEPGRC